MSEARGATAADWFHFDFVLGLGAHLLPCVPASPGVVVAKGSALEGKIGKIPSQFNRNGEAHGISSWQQRQILSNEVQLWSKDPRLNVCVRTGAMSGVYAFDVDIDDKEKVDAIEAVIGVLPARTRANSAKALFPFRMEGVECKKRKIKLDNNRRGPAIELLADGQQFVAAGLHSSGVQYQWRGGLPQSLPILTMDQVNQIWTALTRRYAIETTPSSTPTDTGSLSDLTQLTTPDTTLIPGTQRPLTTQPNESQSVLTEISESDWADLRKGALTFLLDKVSDNDTWSAVGYGLLSLQATRPAQQLWLEWSRKAVGYEPGAPETWWQTHYREQPRSDWRHIFTIAREKGWGRTSDPSSFPVVTPEEVSSSAGGSPVIEAAPPPLPEKVIVRLSEANFSEIVDQLERIIEPEVYTQGVDIVRLVGGTKIENIDKSTNGAEISRSPDALVIGRATKAWMRKRFGELAVFMKYASAKEEWYATAPSAEHINTLIELGGWNLLKPLDAIARAPFVRADGTICDRPGYDPRSRALYVPSADYPRIPTAPSYSDAQAALGRIRRIFDQFPWKSGDAESAFLSHILSEASRLAVDRCPMFWYSAPIAGTGKGLLQEMASIIVHGTEPALRPWVSEGEEIRKALFATLMAGDRSILLDNVPTGYKARSPELCAFLTASTWKDRKLGESEVHAIPNRAVVSASGNNITPVSDLSRRSIVIRLDANTERLAERRFKIADLRGYVMKNRPELLVDALTVIRAFHQRTKEVELPVPLPSFERWSHVARYPLIWMGLPDPVLTQKDETDDEVGSVGSVFEKLAAHFGSNEFSGVDVAHLAGGIADANGELTNSLIQAGCAEPNSALKVGYWLRGERDKISNGLKLVRGSEDRRGVKWKLVKMSGNEDLT